MAFSLKKNKEAGAQEGSSEAVAAEGGREKPDRKLKRGKRGSGKQGRAIKPKKSRAKRFVLIVGDDGGILVFMHGVKVVRRLFAPSAQPSHTEAMRELMRSNPAVPIYLLADVMDQQYVPQPFPPVSSLSIAGLVKRRLDQSFPSEDLKGSLQLGRDKTGRKEWRYLLVSLAKTALMTEWLDLVVELPNEMKGVYLVPIEGVSYIDMLNRSLGVAEPSEWQLLISHNKISGFRQIVTHNGKLVFTRISQAIDDAIPAVIAGNIEQEIINTVEYLKRLDFKENSDLSVSVIISQDVIDSLDLKRFGLASSHALTPVQVADALGLEQAALSADRFGDVVMASALGIATKRYLRFSTAYMDKLAKIYQAQLGIKVVSGLVLVALLGMTVLGAIDIVKNQSEIGKIKAESNSQASVIRKLEASVKNLASDVAFKSTAVAAYDAYIKDAPDHREAMRGLMSVMSDKARILELNWVSKNGIGAGPNNAAPSNPAGQNFPTEIAIKVDFSRSGKKPEELSRAAQDFMQAVKKLDYEIDPVGTYPWDKTAAADGGSLGLTDEIKLSDQEKIAAFTMRGPTKKKEGGQQ